MDGVVWFESRQYDRDAIVVLLYWRLRDCLWVRIHAKSLQKHVDFRNLATAIHIGKVFGDVVGPADFIYG